MEGTCLARRSQANVKKKKKSTVPNAGEGGQVCTPDGQGVLP